MVQSSVGKITMTWPVLTFPLTLPFWTPWIFIGLGVLFALFGFFKGRGEGLTAIFYTLLAVGLALLLWFAPFIHLQ
jgi:hypothetical protein